MRPTIRSHKYAHDPYIFISPQLSSLDRLLVAGRSPKVCALNPERTLSLGGENWSCRWNSPASACSAPQSNILWTPGFDIDTDAR